MLKLGLHMGNELFYCGIENWTPCFNFSLYLSIFLSFKARIRVTVFYKTVQARIFKYGIHVHM